MTPESSRQARISEVPAKRETSTIRTTDKDGIAGILATGRPAGYWMARRDPFPGAAVSAHWTGAVSDGTASEGSGSVSGAGIQLEHAENAAVSSAIAKMMASKDFKRI